MESGYKEDAGILDFKGPLITIRNIITLEAATE
jgi:hypothetical protein